MSTPELKKQQGELAIQVEKATVTLTNKKTQLDESKEKASQFESLFSEGVVSKKELEQAKFGIDEEEDQFMESKRRLTDLQSQLNSVNTRLKSLTRSAQSKSKLNNGKNSVAPSATTKLN
jgi:multidrug resistance efflux pump